jgi:hypothetical protein
MAARTAPINRGRDYFFVQFFVRLETTRITSHTPAASTPPPPGLFRPTKRAGLFSHSNEEPPKHKAEVAYPTDTPVTSIGEVKSHTAII